MDLAAELRASPLFERLEAGDLAELAVACEPLELRGGAVLMRIGEPSETLYLVVSGRLRALKADGRAIGEIARGEPIGEIGLLAGEPRSAQVVALRDSLLIRVPRGALYTLFQRHPEALLAITRTVIRRMRLSDQDRRRSRGQRPTTVALVAGTPGVDVVGLAAGLAGELARVAQTRLISRQTVEAALGAGSADTPFEEGEANHRLLRWLSEQEREARYLVYLASPEPGSWARRCLRQADRICVVLDGAAAARPGVLVEQVLESGTAAPLELLFLRPAGAPVPAVAEWRALFRATSHAFLDRHRPADLARLARNLSGRAVGLVLGGGGARGFAHLGLLRALDELEIPVDAVGGASMGAFFAALHAAGHDVATIRALARDTFVTHNHLNDYLFPSVALVRGRKFTRRLQAIFGETRIEALPTPYFCVTTNLSLGRAEVHEEGPVYLWTAASMAVPGVAPPVVWRENLLVDGALLNSLPTDVMQARERGPVIASDVSTGSELKAPGIEGPDPEGLFHWPGPGRRPGLFNILFRTATVGGDRDAKSRAALADAYLRMPVGDVALFDWPRFDEVEETGYRHALAQLSAERERLLGVPP